MRYLGFDSRLDVVRDVRFLGWMPGDEVVGKVADDVVAEVGSMADVLRGVELPLAPSGPDLAALVGIAKTFGATEKARDLESRACSKDATAPSEI